MNRDKNILLLSEVSVWDLIVIGGGATGLGAALDAASRGMKVLLIEKYDFSKGTSSKSTKLIHGGVRYLKNAEFKLVRKALQERYILKKNAPHLVQNKDFIIPIYNWVHFIFYGIGLKLYDAISGKWSFGGTKFLNKKATIEHLNSINTKGLKGGVKYKDGQFDDARFAISLAHTIEIEGGTVLNYMEYLSPRIGKNSITGIIAYDKIDQKEFHLSSKYIINATGVFSNKLMMSIASKFKIKASRGTHIVVDRSFLDSQNAIMIPKTIDGRVLFVIPWNDKTLIGTTDEESNEIDIDLITPLKDIDFILENVKHYLFKYPQKKDIKSVFTGLRPLVSNNDNSSTKELSRAHIIHESDEGIIHVLGGKWTTYRLMGSEAIDYLLRDKIPQFGKSTTSSLPLFGFKDVVDFQDPLHVYGSELNRLKTFGSMVSLSNHIFISEAMISHAIQEEMAINLEDVLARRTRCLFIDANETIKIAPKVARIMAKVLKKDGAWTAKQLDLFLPLASKYIV